MMIPDRIFLAYLFTNCAFVLRHLHKSPRHFNQKRSSFIVSLEGIFPAKEAPGISSSVNFMLKFSKSDEAILKTKLYAKCFMNEMNLEFWRVNKIVV